MEDKDDRRFFPHFMWGGYRNIKLPPVNVFSKVCIKNWQPIGQGTFPAQINHYYTRSLEEYEEKISRGDAFYEKSMHRLDAFWTCENMCQSVDYHAYKYLCSVVAKFK